MSDGFQRKTINIRQDMQNDVILEKSNLRFSVPLYS